VSGRDDGRRAHERRREKNQKGGERKAAES